MDARMSDLVTNSIMHRQ